MKYTIQKQIIFTVGMGFFLNACGGGGSGGGENIPPQADHLIPLCSENKPVDVTGKTIKKIEDGAKVKIIHAPDTKKMACMLNGKAQVID